MDQVYNILVEYWFRILEGTGDKEGIGIEHDCNRHLKAVRTSGCLRLLPLGRPVTFSVLKFKFNASPTSAWPVGFARPPRRICLTAPPSRSTHPVGSIRQPRLPIRPPCWIYPTNRGNHLTHPPNCTFPIAEPSIHFYMAHIYIIRRSC